MKRLLSILLAAAVLLCGLTALADAAQGSEDGAGWFDMPRIKPPKVPEIEAPEVPEVEVPEVPTAAPTEKPKIEVPEIPQVDAPEADVPGATAEVDSQVEASLEAMGVTNYRALYDALNAGDTVGAGSSGDAARGLQQLLTAFGQGIAVDGIVGPKTIAALNAVQEQCGLPQTDRLDAVGLAALMPLLLATEQEQK